MAFKGCTELTKIEIPDRVTSIGDSAFAGCSKLEEVILPDNISSMGGEVFYGTKWLEKERTKRDDKLVMIYDGTILIDGNASTGKITIPDTVTTICSNAFSMLTGDTVKEVTINSKVINVANEAFSSCNPNVKINVYWKEGEKPAGWDENWNGGMTSATVVYPTE